MFFLPGRRSLDRCPYSTTIARSLSHFPVLSHTLVHRTASGPPGYLLVGQAFFCVTHRREASSCALTEERVVFHVLFPRRMEGGGKGRFLTLQGGQGGLARGDPSVADDDLRRWTWSRGLTARASPASCCCCRSAWASWVSPRPFPRGGRGRTGRPGSAGGGPALRQEGLSAGAAAGLTPSLPRRRPPTLRVALLGVCAVRRARDHHRTLRPRLARGARAKEDVRIPFTTPLPLGRRRAVPTPRASLLPSRLTRAPRPPAGTSTCCPCACSSTWSG